MSYVTYPSQLERRQEILRRRMIQGIESYLTQRLAPRQRILRTRPRNLTRSPADNTTKA